MNSYIIIPISENYEFGFNLISFQDEVPNLTGFPQKGQKTDNNKMNHKRPSHNVEHTMQLTKQPVKTVE